MVTMQSPAPEVRDEEHIPSLQSHSLHCMNCDQCEAFDHYSNNHYCARVLAAHQHQQIVQSKLMESSEVYTFSVGSKETKITCHSRLFDYFCDLRAVSTLYDSMETCNIPNDRKYNLPAFDDLAFRSFVAWVYSGGVVKVAAGRSEGLDKLAEQWILGEKLIVPRFQNEVMHTLVNDIYKEGKIAKLMTPDVVYQIYEQNGKDSKLRAFARHHVNTVRPLSDAIREKYASTSFSWDSWSIDWMNLLIRDGPGADFAKENGDAFLAVEVAVKGGPRPRTILSFSEQIHQFLVEENSDPAPVAEDYDDEYSNASGSDPEVEASTNRKMMK